MTAFKFSLSRLLWIVAGFAISIVALVSASAWWASVFLTAVVGALLFGICKAISSRGRQVVFWLSFSLCGWAYFFLAFGTLLTVSESLLTTKLLTWAHSQVPSRHALAVGGQVSVEWNQSWFPATILAINNNGEFRIHYDGDTGSTWDEWVAPARVRSHQPAWEEFHQIGQAIWTAIVAVLAGLAGQWLRSEESAAISSP